MGYPTLGLDGVPPSILVGVPPPHPRRKIGNYAAGGMPLSFTQEDLLVTCVVNKNFKTDYSVSIFQAQVALRNLKSFAEYPMRMQTKIVQVGKYER